MRSGYTITQLSAATRRRYGSQSPYFVPATFLYQLRRGVTPHVCQLAALSESTGYRFADWMRICGFELQQISRLQMQLHPERTVLVTPIENGFDPFSFPPSTSPERWNAANCSRLEAWSAQRRYLYARIGTSDALSCPQVPPGSIVRVDRACAERILGLDHAATEHLLWLVEQASGLTCCRVRWIDDRQIVLLPSRLPWGLLPLHVPTEARILGLVDRDIPPPARLRLRSPGLRNPEDFYRGRNKEERIRVSDLLRISRRRTGLTFRAAHRLTRTVAQILASPEYRIALGMLSDYEADGRLPRHVSKILSLCVVYCMDFRDLMESAGVFIDDSAKLSLPPDDVWVQSRAEFADDIAQPGTGRGLNRYARAAGAQS